MSRIRLIVLREEGDNRPLTHEEWTNLIKQLEEQQRALTVHMRDGCSVLNLDLSGHPTTYDKFVEHARKCYAETTIDSFIKSRPYKRYYFGLSTVNQAALTRSFNMLKHAGLETLGDIRNTSVKKLHDFSSLGNARIELLTKIFDLH